MIDNLDTTKSFNVSYDGNNKIDVFALNGVNNKHYYDDSYNKTSNATMGFNYDIKNRLSSYSLSGNTINLTYDDNGNTLTEGTTVYGYDLRNNLISVNKAGAVSTYGFNGLGQRTIKTVSGSNNYYLYDEAGNLAGEYDNAGSVISEHIYLNGVPVGLVKANILYNVHTDQIGTPRVITNSANVIVWKWDNVDPYGGNLPSINTIVYNKRFSGQYFDNESKLHYNYYRTYNPLVGRYIQSDPLGLAAGFNTYNYVEGNPFGGIDPNGLWLQYAVPTATGAIVGGVIGGISGYYNGSVLSGIKEGAVTGALTGLAITGAGRIIGAVLGEGVITQIGANVLGASSSEIARQLIFEDCNNINWTNVGFAGFVGGIFSPISKPYILAKQNVVSWAEKGMVSDLNSGRWVMAGYSNKRNYYLSGIGERKYPISNSVEGVVNGNNLTYPVTGYKWEVIKGLWGQRNIK